MERERDINTIQMIWNVLEQHPGTAMLEAARAMGAKRVSAKCVKTCSTAPVFFHAPVAGAFAWATKLETGLH